MPVLKPGVRCRIIGRPDPDSAFKEVIFDGKSPNHGKIVTVVKWMGDDTGGVGDWYPDKDAIPMEGSNLGDVWRCTGDIVLHNGIRAIYADFPAATLEVIPDEPLPVAIDSRLLTA